MGEAMFTSVAENKSIRDSAYEKLKHAIITGELQAGSRIVETTYAQILHISRTPLREALRKLERDGLVSYEVRHGVVVRAFTLDDIDQIFTIRNAMISLLIPSIVERATAKDIAELRMLLSEMDVAQTEEDCEALAGFNRAFHSKFEHISDKTRILHVIDNQQEFIQRFSAITIADIVRRSGAHQEHHQMVNLLEKRDLEGLTRLNTHHLQESKDTCMRTVSAKGYY